MKKPSGHIHSFECENFYSFLGSSSVSFVVDNKAPKNDGYFTAPSGTRLSKAEVIIGPNGSGKTNLLKVLPFFKWLIVDSFNQDPQAPIIMQNFAFQEDKDKPSTLSAVFEIDGDIYNHRFILNKQRILFEELRVRNKTKTKVTNKKVFSNTWDEKAGSYIIDGKSFGLPKGFENVIRANSSALASAARLNHRKSQEIINFWTYMSKNVIEAGWTGDHLLPNKTHELWDALHFYNINVGMKKEVEKLLSKFDLGLEEINVVEKMIDNEHLSVDANTIHLIDGKRYKLSLGYESSGTKQLLITLRYILHALSKGSFVVLDEFDSSLHPEIVLAIFELFTHKETNPNNAQIILSTHSHLVLSQLDKQQILLVEKGSTGASESWRLDDVSGVRADENYYAKYVAGAYGALPNIQ